MLFSSKLASRKYVDLIYQESSKWANTPPQKPIEVGSYGHVDRETGEFNWEGSVYKNEATAGLAAQFPPVKAEPIDSYLVQSSEATRRDFILGPELSVPGLAEASLKVQWQFGKNRGAVLAMRQVLLTYMPDEFLRHLIGVSYLKGKSLVTSVYSTPAYYLYLSNCKNENVQVALRANVPIPVPGLAAGGEVGVGWWSEGTSGRHECASGPTESFFPLYGLKSIRAPGIFRRDGAGRVDVDSWDDPDTPWENLDENGEEEEFVDD